jgi:hypothetical protein
VKCLYLYSLMISLGQCPRVAAKGQNTLYFKIEKNCSGKQDAGRSSPLMLERVEITKLKKTTFELENKRIYFVFESQRSS